ncbi:MAG: YfhO family protein, partial [Blastocatellia bacterium]
MLGQDPLIYSLPLRTVAWGMLQQGSLPLWTPLILSGYPLLSMAQLGLAYPLTWGYLFFPNYVAEQIYVLAPFLLAPLFTYAWLRELGRSRVAALLGGMSFGFGGMMASLLSNGMLPNAVMWLPLLLIALKRAGRQNFLSCLLGATAACTMSLLTGIGQGFLLVILLALAWSVFQALPIVNPTEKGLRQRLAPLATLICALAASAGIAAFQLLETMQAARQSIRASLNYETFTEQSFTAPLIWKSFIAPLFHHENWIEVTTFAPLPIALLPLLAIILAARGRMEAADRTEVLFWTGVAAAAFVLMLGGSTPLYRLLYRIPILNQFRAPSRHAYEWSFAISALAAYGWDGLKAAWRPSSPMWQSLRFRSFPIASTALLIFAGMIGIAWRLATADNPARALLLKTGDAETAYVIWKLIFTLLLIIGGLLALNVHSAKLRAGLFLSAVFLVCLVEPYILMSRWWGRFPVPMSRPSAISPVTQFLRNYSSTQNRIYTRVHIITEQATSAPRLDPPNLTALHGLHNVAGYEPLMMRRYSRSLGDAGLNAVHPGYAGEPDETLF